MEFTIELFKCDTCDDCEGHPEDYLTDLLIVPPPPEVQTGVPFSVCPECRQQMRDNPSNYTVIEMGLR